MTTPNDRKYAESHEWHQLGEDGLVTVGISQYAVDELSDVTYVEFIKTEGAIEAGEVFGEIESVKTTSELYCAVAGEIVEVNQGLNDDPEPVNADCHAAGWLIKVRPADPAALEAEMDALMDAAAYDAQTG